MAIPLPAILKQKYPARLHIAKALDALRALHKSPAGEKSLWFVPSAVLRLNEDNDQAAPFRQRRSFYYLSGCELPDSALVYNVAADESTLFIPAIDPDDVVWSGLPMSPKQAKAQYDVDHVKAMPELQGFLAPFKKERCQFYGIDEQTPEWVLQPDDENRWGDVDKTSLKKAIEEARASKTDHEVALIRHANDVSRHAHLSVMRAVTTATNEQELEALFVYRCAHHGARNQAYSSIVASGTDAATLHYVKNNKAMGIPAPVPGGGAAQGQGTDNLDRTPEGIAEKAEHGQGQPLNLLIDAGCEVNCYASDITRTYPVNGKFTKESLDIYNIVLQMQTECMQGIKAGVLWDELHEHAHRVLIAGLLKLGIFKGEFQDIYDSRVSTAFLPHGLGHFMGMDTHDTAGQPNYNDTDPMFRYLRVRRKLPVGAVITVEPGCYFCHFVIDPWLEKESGKKFIDTQVLEKYWQVGGVRIEDNVLVTADGHDNMTAALLRDPHEIESWISGHDDD